MVFLKLFCYLYPRRDFHDKWQQGPFPVISGIYSAAWCTILFSVGECEVLVTLIRISSFMNLHRTPNPFCMKKQTHQDVGEEEGKTSFPTLFSEQLVLKWCLQVSYICDIFYFIRIILFHYFLHLCHILFY